MCCATASFLASLYAHVFRARVSMRDASVKCVRCCSLTVWFVCAVGE